MRELGAALRVLRTIRGLSQTDVASRAGITKGMLCTYELDRQAPSLGSLMAILDALHFRLSALEEAAAFVLHLQEPAYRPPFGGKQGARPDTGPWSAIRFNLGELREEPQTLKPERVGRRKT